MKTKRIVVALMAIGAYLTSNAQWEWNTASTGVTGSTSLARTGDISVNSLSLTGGSTSGNYVFGRSGPYYGAAINFRM